MMIQILGRWADLTEDLYQLRQEGPHRAQGLGNNHTTCAQVVWLLPSRSTVSRTLTC